MTPTPLQDKITDLQTALQGPAQAELPLPRMEDLKAWLDDTRFRIWGQLQTAQTSDPAEFEDRFRVRRASELCQRLAEDVSAGRIDSSRPELGELQAAARDLDQAITTARSA